MYYERFKIHAISFKTTLGKLSTEAQVRWTFQGRKKERHKVGEIKNYQLRQPPPNMFVCFKVFPNQKKWAVGQCLEWSRAKRTNKENTNYVLWFPSQPLAPWLPLTMME